MPPESPRPAERPAAGPPGRAPALARLAVIVTQGTFNNLVQVATLVHAAAGMGASVRVLFRDAALLAVRRDRIDALPFGPETTCGCTPARRRCTTATRRPRT